MISHSCKYGNILSSLETWFFLVLPHVYLKNAQASDHCLCAKYRGVLEIRSEVGKNDVTDAFDKQFQLLRKTIWLLVFPFLAWLSLTALPADCFLTRTFLSRKEYNSCNLLIGLWLISMIPAIFGFFSASLCARLRWFKFDVLFRPLKT